MAVRKFKPISPGTRFRVGNTYNEVTTNKPEKSLLEPIKKSGGRNASGRTTVPHRGGGHKKRYRVIDWKRDKENVVGKVVSIEYDPNRTAFIALIEYSDGEKRYIIAPQQLKVGGTVLSGSQATPDIGHTMFLKDIPLGSVIHNVELHPGQGGSIVRSAGSAAVMMGREDKHAVVKLPSGEVRRVLLTCKATIGAVSNPDHALTVFGKAGAKRWTGRRPRVRGVAMNPVDHPMGGGEGKASGGHPTSRTGIMAKGQKTRNPRKSSKLIISRRKSKNKS
ncbi:MAG: 50S ribosomal protein L2 [Bacteroidota bacterium]|nr:50S ribosomal protein L2 [Bacteroidota bacterium]